jgi:hypothetical protein
MMISPAVAPAFKPTLAIRVGFAGHRDLARVGGETAATTATVTILEILKAAVADLSGRTVSDSEVFADLYAHRGLRLVTGLAPGADQLMIRQWRAAGFSDVHGVLPYLDAEGQRPITDRPEFASSKDLTIDLALTDSWTALDTDAAGDGHAEVSRCIVRHSDMLIVFWDGKVGGGPGGTAHSVGLALAKTIPVVWLRPDGAPPVLLAADEWDREALVEGLRTPERYAGELRSSALADALTVGLLPPWSADRGVGGNDPEVASRRDYVQRDPLRFANSAARILDAALRRSLWSSFDWFERTIGGSNGENKSATRPPAPCPVAGQAGYELLANEFAIADERAQRLGAVHRSEQLILLVLAVLAVAAAAIPSAFADRLATWPPFAVAGAAEAKDRVHFFALVTEFGFAVLALGIWSLARRAHRHRRWSDARRLWRSGRSASTSRTKGRTRPRPGPNGALARLSQPRAFRPACSPTMRFNAASFGRSEACCRANVTITVERRATRAPSSMRCTRLRTACSGS